MSDIDISILTRLTDAALAANPELAAQVVPILRAADSDGQPNAEDQVFSEAEARAYVSGLRQAHRRTMSLFRANRAAFVGDLSAAQDRIRRQEGGESLVAFLEMAASMDAEHPLLSPAERQRLAGELSAEEIQALSDHLDQISQQGDGITADGVLQGASALVGMVQSLELSLPEAMIPQDSAAQRAAVDLNFLKHIPGAAFTGTDEGSIMLQSILEIAGVDHGQADADWSLTFEEVEAHIARMPEEERSQLGSAERLLGDLRFVAHNLREEMNRAISQADSVSPDLRRLGLSVQPLIDRHALINDAAVDQLLAVAGDATLSTLEVERILRLEEAQNPGFLREMLADAPAGAEGETDLQRATGLYMSEARALIDRYNREVAAISPSVPSEPADRHLAISRHVLTALENMRAGFTHRDREYAERNALVGLIDMVTYVCTLGGALTWLGAGAPRAQTAAEIEEFGEDWARFGPTYRHLVREQVESHDAERGRALRALRDIIEHPPADFTGERTIPNALEYLRSHDDLMGVSTGRGLDAAVVEGSRVNGTGENQRYYELLTGDFFRAEELWRIHTEADGERQEEMWYDFAQFLRSGDAGGWFPDGTHSAGVRNTDYARAILHALRTQSTDEPTRDRAQLALADSMGWDILDAQGHVVTEHGGEFGIQPWLWFRNYSDENADAVASDVISLAASIYIAGGATSVGRSALTSAGRSSLANGALRFLGIRGTQAAVTETALGTAIEGSTAGMGYFGRIMSRIGGPAWAARRVAQAESALASAQAAGGATEIRAAEAALSRARYIQGVLTAPTMGALPEAAAPRLTGWVAAHPPVPAALTQAAAGTGLRAVAARGTANLLNNLSMAGAGRGLRWLGFEGIFIYGITGQVFDRTRTRTDQENMQDHDLELDLRLRPRGSRGSDEASAVREGDTEAPSATTAEALSDDTSTPDMVFGLEEIEAGDFDPAEHE